MKNVTEILKSIRKQWTMNPVTRVHDNKLKKDKKKLRAEGKKIVKNYDDGK